MMTMINRSKARLPGAAVLCLLVSMLWGEPIRAQEKPARPPQRGKVVKGAPYSAEAVTESIQTLANGTKLAQKTTALVYRDSEGRTRREQPAAAIGPLGTGGRMPRMIFINDPVAGVSYTLYPDSRTGYKVALAPPLVVVQPKQKQIRKAQEQAGPDRKRNPAKPPPKEEVEHPSFIPEDEGGERKLEQLGKRSIEGFNADGERTTVVIPVNRIGNDQPIEITEERWKSPELRATLWSKTTDPRWGENIYKLVNIDRAEPDRALFVVPEDYVIQEGRRGEDGRRRPPRR